MVTKLNNDKAALFLSMIRLFSIIVFLIFLLEEGESLLKSKELSHSAILLFVAITGLVVTWKYMLPGAIIIIVAGALMGIMHKTFFSPGIPLLVIGILFIIYLLVSEKVKK